MQILILTPALPYPMHQGGAIRNAGLIRGLRDAGHEITLLSFFDGVVDPLSTPLADWCGRIEVVPTPQRSKSARLRDLFTSRQPDIARRLESAAFRAKLDTVLNETAFDLVQFEGLEMAIYVDQVQQKQPAAKLVYDAHNAEFALQKAIFQVDRTNPRRLPAAVYSLIQTQRITRFERRICHQTHAVVAVSDEDASALKQLGSTSCLTVVPNGIFAETYQAGGEKLDLGENVLVFTGKMDYRPNVDAMLWFADSILPRVREQLPQVQLYIVGQKPHPKLEALRDEPGIEITGWVADIQPFLQAADVYVAPLRMGSGTRLKLLEALASGCAVIATPAAASGLNAAVRAQMMIAESEAEFAAAITDLMRDAEQRRELGAAAREIVAAHYDWSALMPRLLQTYREIGLG